MKLRLLFTFVALFAFALSASAGPFGFFGRCKGSSCQSSTKSVSAKPAPAVTEAQPTKAKLTYSDSPVRYAQPRFYNLGRTTSSCANGNCAK